MNRPSLLAALALLSACTHVGPPTPTGLPPVTQPSASVVRPAPNLSLATPSGTKTLAQLRGQPVVLLLGDSASRSRVKDQSKLLEASYSKLAARKVLFLAAFTNASDQQVQSNIPFALVQQPEATLNAYTQLAQQSDKSAKTPAIAVIGPDGNVDYIGEKVLSGERIREIILNNHYLQTQSRRPVE
jgi:peroxiredoxin